MALYIDFNFINIRDLIDLSEIDSEFENQLQNFVEEMFENPSESQASETEVFEESAIRFLSEIVAESETEMTAKTSEKDVADIISTPIVPAVTPKKTSVDKNEAYIKYINNKYEQSQADYFINVLLNPVQTHLRNRFDYADARNRYLQNQILSKDKDSTEKTDEIRRRQDEKMRNIESERRIEALKSAELNRIFELKNREQYKRV
jgi:hypothetical protein